MATAKSRLFLLLTAFPCLLQAQTTVTLTANPGSPSIFGAPVTLTATVTPATATGRVAFYDGVTVLGSKSLTSGAASISTIALPAGTRKLRAYYAGAGSNAAATSNVVTQVVNAQASAGFAASGISSIYPVAAIGDFNGDGHADLLTMGGSPTLITLLGDGAGNFSPTTALTLSGGFGAPSVADFNGDGKLDLAMASVDGLAISLGNGDGTFQPLNLIVLPNALSNLAVADFNGDGIPDIAASNLEEGVEIRIGKGDGTFQTAVTYSTSSQTGTSAQATFVVAADFNGDGKVDLATSNQVGTVTILLGKGDGTFQAPTINTVGYPVFSPFVLADFNNDGIPDLAGLSSSTGPGPNFAVVLGGRDGNFIGYFAQQLPFSGTLVAGDFNGDGIADLAIGVITSPTGSFVTPTTYILLGNGDGSFQPPVSYPLGAAAASGDFNGDGILDLVVNGNSVTLFTSSILFGNGDGTFRQGFALPVVVGAPLVADFNGDGRADMLVAGTNSFTVLTGITSVTLSVTATGGTPQSTSLGAAFPARLQVMVMNNGVPVSGAVVTFHAPTTGASATLSSTTAVTNASGVASVTATANGTAGAYIVTATVGSLSTSFSLTNTAIQPATLTATGGTPQTATLGSVFTNALQATVKDSSGNPLSGVTVTFTAPTVGASAILSSATAVTNASGVASVTARANSIAGSYAVNASVGSLSTVFLLSNTLGSNTNLAQGKPASQSSTLAGTPPASVAVDGNTDGAFFNGSVTATNADTNAWWQVDLGTSASIGSIVIWNRTDCCGSRLSDYWVFVSDTPFLATDTPATLAHAGINYWHETIAPNPSFVIAGTVVGRYVRIQLSGTGYLSLAEVQVFGIGGPSPTNLSQGKPATQSSTLAGVSTAGAGSAVDGSTDGNFFDGSVTATNPDSNAWWQVDLGASASISSIVIWNRTDCCSSRLSDYWVFVSDSPFLATDTPATLQNRAGTFAYHQMSASTPSANISVIAQGRYVRVQLSGTDYLSLAEVQVFGTGGASTSNLSQGKAASQSSTLAGVPSAGAASAVDGNTDGSFFDGSVTATNPDTNAWWQVDLGASAAVSSVSIYNRTDCCGTRLSDYWVFVSNTPFLATDTPATLQSRAGTFASHQTSAPSPSASIPVNAPGRYVRVQLSGADYLSLAEVQVFGQ